jgi:hypothetical protein
MSIEWAKRVADARKKYDAEQLARVQQEALIKSSAGKLWDELRDEFEVCVQEFKREMGPTAIASISLQDVTSSFDNQANKIRLNVGEIARDFTFDPKKSTFSTPGGPVYTVGLKQDADKPDVVVWLNPAGQPVTSTKIAEDEIEKVINGPKVTLAAGHQRRV